MAAACGGVAGGEPDPPNWSGRSPGAPPLTDTPIPAGVLPSPLIFKGLFFGLGGVEVSGPNPLPVRLLTSGVTDFAVEGLEAGFGFGCDDGAALGGSGGGGWVRSGAAGTGAAWVSAVGELTPLARAAAARAWAKSWQRG